VNFSELLKQSGPTVRKPPGAVTLPPGAWSDAREDKPLAPVEIGLRLLSELDITTCKERAEKRAALVSQHGEADDKAAAYNQALMCAFAECGTCMPHDATQPYFIAGEDEIRHRLTWDGIRRIWHELEALRAANDPSIPELDDEGFAHLAAMHHRGICWQAMPPSEARRARRLLELVRMTMSAAEERSGQSIVSG
jgi:hypothetical protein